MPKRSASTTSKSSNKRQAKGVTSNKRKAPSSSTKKIDTSNNDIEEEEITIPPTKKRATRGTKNSSTYNNTLEIESSPKPIVQSTATKAKSTSKPKSSVENTSSSSSRSNSSNSSSSSNSRNNNINALSGVIVGAPSFNVDVMTVTQVASQRVVEEMQAKNNKKNTPFSAKNQSNHDGLDADYIDKATTNKTTPRKRTAVAHLNNSPISVRQEPTSSSSSSSSSSSGGDGNSNIDISKTLITEKNASMLYLIVLGLCVVLSFLMPYTPLPSVIGIGKMTLNTNNDPINVQTDRNIAYSSSSSTIQDDNIGKVLDFDELQTEMHDRHMDEIVTIRIHTDELLTQAGHLTSQNDSTFNYTTTWLYDVKETVSDIYHETEEMETDLILIKEEVDKELERIEERKSNQQTIDTPRVISAVKDMKKWIKTLVNTLQNANLIKDIELGTDSDLDLNISSGSSDPTEVINNVEMKLEEDLREPEKFTAFVDKMISTTSVDLDNILQGVKPVESADTSEIQMIQLENTDSENEEKFLQDREKFIEETVSKVKAMIADATITTMDYASSVRGGQVWVGRLPPQFSGSNNFYPATSTSLASNLNYIGKVRYTSQLKSLGHSPSVMIDMKPVSTGECYAISGKSGSITLILSEDIILHGITIAHAPSNDALPFVESSALKSFVLSGWTGKPDTTTGTAGTKIHFGEYTFEPMESTSAYHRAFKVNQPVDAAASDDTALELVVDSKGISEPIRSISIDFKDNHGNDDYTCIYKVRVFGVSASSIKHKKSEQIDIDHEEVKEEQPQEFQQELQQEPSIVV